MRTLVIHPKDKTTDFLKPIYHGRDFTVITGGCTKDDVAKAIDEHDHIIMMGHGTPQGLLAMGQFNGKPKVRVTPKPSAAIRKDGPVTPSKIKDFYGSKKKDVAPVTKSLLDDLPEYEDEDDWFNDRKVGGGFYNGGKTYGYACNNLGGLTTGYVIDDSMADKLRGKKLTAIWCNADQYMEWNDLEGFYTGMFISDTSEATMIGTADTEQWQVDESNYAFAAIMRELVNYPADQVITHAKRIYGKLAERNAVAKYNLLRLYTRKAEQKAEVAAI